MLGILPIPDGPALMMLDDVATQQNGVKDCPELSDIFVNARHPRIRRACGRPQYGLRPFKYYPSDDFSHSLQPKRKKPHRWPAFACSGSMENTSDTAMRWTSRHASAPQSPRAGSSQRWQ